MRARFPTASLPLAAALLAGCAGVARPPAAPPPEGSASYRVAPDAAMAHYQLALGQVSSGAAPFRRVAPVYPPEQWAACPPPVEVPALLIVDEAGKVGEVRVAGEAQADPARRAFIAATRAAALQWEFQPLRIERWAADANGDSHVVDSDTRPFSLAYVFRFECRAGRAVTSAGRAG
ncbi:hypothetical protein [Fulvimonas soli]|uniref:TonB-like protein n=1 Tax=Fulvimonas soli TaxID=155197 RepID=A0A316IFW1_9GAMM|nr:hypothetical protein [Fulvimonas soli]PWK92362.1 hypothetical protein C7456_10295 [Fulvimonas soli]TNY25936.1 hypothetical protein BV497_11425 [Fulvimonas soli]